jgi:hypothetical protein
MNRCWSAENLAVFHPKFVHIQPPSCSKRGLSSISIADLFIGPLMQFMMENGGAFKANLTQND